MSLTDATCLACALMHGHKGQFKFLSEFLSSLFLIFLICSLFHFALVSCPHWWETLNSTNRTGLEITASDFVKNVFKHCNIYSVALRTKKNKTPGFDFGITRRVD